MGQKPERAARLILPALHVAADLPYALDAIGNDQRVVSASPRAAPVHDVDVGIDERERRWLLRTENRKHRKPDLGQPWR
ncbi:hypothetical protein D9M72_608390 [compost metagenome]